MSNYSDNLRMLTDLRNKKMIAEKVMDSLYYYEDYNHVKDDSVFLAFKNSIESQLDEINLNAMKLERYLIHLGKS